MKIYCINLDRRTDRWEESKAEFEKWNLNVERFPAIDGGVAGAATAFNKSQYAVLKKAVKLDKALILEDDVVFTNDFSSLIECDLFALGATVNKAKHDGKGYRYIDGWATQAMVYNKKLMKWILDNFDPLCGTIYDEWLRVNVLPKFECYVAHPLIAWQRPSFSDIRNGYVDYVGMMRIGEELIINR